MRQHCKKNIEREHFFFKNYMAKKRWSSLYHQIDEVIALQPRKVLEIGLGPGLFKVIMEHMGVQVDTVDSDICLKPDCCACAQSLPLASNTYDCVCAFQVLEHLPYATALIAFEEFVRISKGYIVISLPDNNVLWPYSFHLPGKGSKVFHLPKPNFPFQRRKINEQHHWEINSKGFELEKVKNDFVNRNVEIRKTYRVDEFPYHRFIVCNIVS